MPDQARIAPHPYRKPARQDKIGRKHTAASTHTPSSHCVAPGQSAFSAHSLHRPFGLQTPWHMAPQMTRVDWYRHPVDRHTPSHTYTPGSDSTQSIAQWSPSPQSELLTANSSAFSQRQTRSPRHDPSLLRRAHCNQHHYKPEYRDNTRSASINTYSGIGMTTVPTQSLFSLQVSDSMHSPFEHSCVPIHGGIACIRTLQGLVANSPHEALLITKTVSGFNTLTVRTC